MRLEIVLSALFLVAWLLTVGSFLGGLPLAGALELGLYELYGLAALLGWLGGNLYVQRMRFLPDRLRRTIRWIYYLGPPGVLFFLRTLASREIQQAAPLVVFYAFGVFSVLFLVPVTLARTAVRRRG